MAEKKGGHRGQVAQHGRIGKPPDEYISTLSPAISHEFHRAVELNILYSYFNIRNPNVCIIYWLIPVFR